MYYLISVSRFVQNILVRMHNTQTLLHLSLEGANMTVLRSAISVFRGPQPNCQQIRIWSLETCRFTQCSQQYKTPIFTYILQNYQMRKIEIIYLDTLKI